MCICVHIRTEPPCLPPTPPPHYPTTPPQNVFHAYEKNVRWHKQTREDLTLLKLLLLPISSFPPASAEETEKERQTEKERVCLYTVGIWNISLWTVLIIAGYSPSTPRHLTLSQSETSAALCGSSGLGVELWGAVVNSSWKKKKRCGVHSAQIARDSHDYPVANQSISWVSVCDACRFAVVAWGVISCLFYCSPKHGVRPHPGSGRCCGSITEHKGNVFTALLYCFSDWFKTYYWGWIFCFFLAFGILVMTLLKKKKKKANVVKRFEAVGL